MKTRKITRTTVREYAPIFRDAPRSELINFISLYRRSNHGVPVTKARIISELAARELERRSRIWSRAWIERQREEYRLRQAKPVETLTEYVLDEKDWIVSCGGTTVSFTGTHEAADALGRKLRGLDDSPATVKPA